MCALHFSALYLLFVASFFIVSLCIELNLSLLHFSSLNLSSLHLSFSPACLRHTDFFGPSWELNFARKFYYFTRLKDPWIWHIEQQHGHDWWGCFEVSVWAASQNSCLARKNCAEATTRTWLLDAIINVDEEDIDLTFACMNGWFTVLLLNALKIKLISKFLFSDLLSTQVERYKATFQDSDNLKCKNCPFKFFERTVDVWAQRLPGISFGRRSNPLLISCFWSKSKTWAGADELMEIVRLCRNISQI